MQIKVHGVWFLVSSASFFVRSIIVLEYGARCWLWLVLFVLIFASARIAFFGVRITCCSVFRLDKFCSACPFVRSDVLLVNGCRLAFGFCGLKRVWFIV